jgi:hypothetical protein
MMRRFKIGRASILLCACLTAAMLALPVGSVVAAKAPTQPRVATGAALHALISSAELTAVINPLGFATSYYFQYGPTVAYGLQTPAVSIGSGNLKMKVGQSVGGLRQGIVYHYRAVAAFAPGRFVFGRDRSFTVAGSKPKLELAKIPQVVVGTPFELTGTLTGFGNANRTVTLQASPFPYLEAFTAIGPPAVTNAFGRFAFRVANLTRSTQFRVVTVDLNPLYSTVITVGAAVRVTLHVRSSGVGLVRLYGTVSPAAVGAHVSFQVEKAVRPGRKASEEETTTKFVSQFSTIVKRGTRTTSRFSAIVKVRHGGRYRAFVRLPAGRLVSGYSTQTVVLRAPKTKH